MKKLLTIIILTTLSGIVIAGEPYYLISRGMVDTSVIAVYGYPDNKSPCITLEKYINKSMEEERNYHRFSCVDSTTAMVADCKDEKNKGYNCVENWKVRHALLKTLNIK
ncbi:MAG TPA: hypothetical protein ENJ28_05640 [Gammaproteobacteria bacterium]|nr:hypothetical protein [Gammaproteobacteria bacterium]